jgi:hypothetical protein
MWKLFWDIQSQTYLRSPPFHASPIKADLLGSRDATEFQDWLKSEVVRSLCTTVMATAKDGNTLLRLAKQVSAQEIFDK